MAFIVEFIVGDPGAPPDGATSYFNPVIAGEQLKVFREGVYQYESLGGNFYVNTNSGTIFFIPQLGAGERLKIQTV